MRCLNETLTIPGLITYIERHISTVTYLADCIYCRLDYSYKRSETWLFLLNRVD